MFRNRSKRNQGQRGVDASQEPSVWSTRVHLSKSLAQSRAWFINQVQMQQRRGGLFEDPFMPADASSIKSTGRGSEHYQWLRPHELTSDPRFIADGISRFDVRQGELGNCWLLAALSSLSMHPELLEQVVPVGQSFSRSGHRTSSSDQSTPYTGMFWFRFWQFGDWLDVVVDDRLPTRSGRLVFMHSSDRNEFWSALLEKAYAKILGSYEAMRGGSTAEAMEDFTGGLTELVDLGPEAPRNLFSIMQRAHSRASLMACSIDAQPHQIEADGPMGLIIGHAYSVTDVRLVPTEGHQHAPLIRLRNPWGNEREWTGPWSDKSHEWRRISPADRKRIGLTFDNDGEFWMELSDFVKFFSRLEFCHLGPESGDFGRSFCKEANQRRWEMRKEEGEWIRYVTAGGCRNYPQTFHMNTQFRIQVIDPDETDDENFGTVVVGLMQKGRREKFQEPHTIGYSIYRLTKSSHFDGPLDRAFFMSNSSVARSPKFINMREICGRHKLEPGTYVIIPSTFEPNQEAKFLLRIFSERACDTNEIDEVTEISDSKTKQLSDEETESLEKVQKLRSAFDTVSGHSGFISYPELRDILNAAFQKDFPFDGFSSETARSMVALSDVSLTGSLSFDEFRKLWEDLRVWKTIFKKFDRDTSGTLDAFELRDVMKMIGFKVSNRVYQAITCRYVNRNGHILFDDYILLLIRLVTVFETFKAQQRVSDNQAVFQLEDFIRTVIYI